jgi:hypothetical protein
MDFIVAQVMDFDRKLDRQISDLDDIRIIMETQKKIRDQEIDMDMKIDLVEEAFSLLAKYQVNVSRNYKTTQKLRLLLAHSNIVRTKIFPYTYIIVCTIISIILILHFIL